MTHEAEPDRTRDQGAQPASPPVPPPLPPQADTRTSTPVGLLRSFHTLRPLRPVVLAAVALVLLIGGVVWWKWPADDGPRVVEGTVQATVLTSGEVSEAVGTTLDTETRMSEPAPSTRADPPGCSVAVGPATTVVYQRGWTAFLSVVHQDSDTAAEHTVTQVVGRYATGTRAGEVFGALAEGIDACTSAVRSAPGGGASRWTYRVDSATDDTLAWTATQDRGEGWACYREARLKASTVLQTAVCQAGDGRTASRALADRMAGRVK